jgi:hypothetical protein
MRGFGLKSVATAVVVVLGLWLAPVASAKLPPSGKYGCTHDGSFFGNLRVDGKRYKKDRSKWGKMVDRGGHKIRFKSGIFKGEFRGYWEKVDSVLQPGKKIVEIELETIEDNFTRTYCTLEKRA